MSPIAEASVYSGDYLNSAGINPLIDKNRSSVILEITAVKK